MPVPEKRFYTFVAARDCLAYMAGPGHIGEIVDFYAIAARGEDPVWFEALAVIADQAEAWIENFTPSGNSTQQSIDQSRLRHARRFVDTVKGGLT